MTYRLCKRVGSSTNFKVQVRAEPSHLADHAKLLAA